MNDDMPISRIERKNGNTLRVYHFANGNHASVERMPDGTRECLVMLRGVLPGPLRQPPKVIVAALRRARAAGRGRLSILPSLPEYVRESIARNDASIRDDLRVIPAAEAAGWRVSFLNGSWHNAATFERGRDAVWCYGPAWRRGRYDDESGRFTDYRDAESPIPLLIP
jgi:hypothetical protein